MKVIDSGQTKLSNVDVLQWITAKRKQNKDNSELPKNYVRALDSHEKHLLRSQHISAGNATYEDTVRSLKTFHQRLNEDIVAPAGAKLKGSGISAAEAKGKTKELERKRLTMTETLTVFNLRPSTPATLQPMLDMAAERFSDEEQETIVRIVEEVFGKSQPARVS